MGDMKRWMWFIFALVFVLWSFYPSWYEMANSKRLPSNRYFELVHNFYTDYNFYLSRIRQGIEGKSSVVEKYTSEPHQGSYIQVMYLAMGWVGGWVRVPWHRSGDVYHVARIVLGMTLLLLIAQFAKHSFQRVGFQVLAFLFAVTAGTWPKLETVAGAPRFGGYMPWWSVMDSLQRITFIPHLLAGQALIVALLMAFSNEKVRSKAGNWVFLGMLGLILGTIFPPGLLFVYAALTVLAALDFIWHVRAFDGHAFESWIRGYVRPAFVIGLLSIPSLLYLQAMTSFYPWKRLAEFDISRPLPFDYLEYFKAVGPILPLGIIGLVLATLQRSKALTASVIWVIAWLALLSIFHFVPQQSPLRFSEMIPHVPLAMLAAYLFMRTIERLRSSHTVPFITHISLFALYVVMVATIAFGLGVMYSSWLWQRDGIDTKQQAMWPLVPTGSYIMYPLKDFISAIVAIQDSTSRDTPILSETTAGNYIPVYAGNSVYVGHANTVRAEEKEERVRQFYSGQMNPSEAQTWLARENLKVVFFGPQEAEDGRITDLSAVYPFLERAYQNGFVTVYRVRQ